VNCPLAPTNQRRARGGTGRKHRFSYLRCDRIGNRTQPTRTCNALYTLGRVSPDTFIWGPHKLLTTSYVTWLFGDMLHSTKSTNLFAHTLFFQYWQNVFACRMKWRCGPF